jgi:hypothetical protein
MSRWRLWILMEKYQKRSKGTHQSVKMVLMGQGRGPTRKEMVLLNIGAKTR